MDFERMEKLAKVLETKTYVRRGVGFDMSDFQIVWERGHRDPEENVCGTTGCIGGWAIALFDPEAWIAGRTTGDRAQTLLGLTGEQAGRLFYNQQGEFGKLWHTDTRKEAAKAVRKLIAEERKALGVGENTGK